MGERGICHMGPEHNSRGRQREGGRATFFCCSQWRHFYDNRKQLIFFLLPPRTAPLLCLARGLFLQ